MTSGNYVKMVLTSIEHADMQLTAEAYDILRVRPLLIKSK